MSNKDEVEGKCKLCLLWKPLKRSHIVSKFLWRELFRSEKSFSITSLTHPEYKIKNQQDGFKEDLLCGECEGKFSKWETYAAPIYTNRGTPLRKLAKGQFIIGNLDYDKLKLFIMSILWRMSVSTHDYYYYANLGKRKDERLRKLLLSETPAEWNSYGCIFTAIKEGGGIFSQPLIIKSEDGCKTINTVIAGVHWHFFVSKIRPHYTAEKFYLMPDGTIRMKTESLLDIPYLRPFIREIQSRNNKVKA